MPVLLVGAPLANFNEPEASKKCRNLPGFEELGSNPLRHLDRLHPYKLRFQFRIAILKKHLDNFSKVALKLVETGALAVSARPSRDISDIECRLRIPLYDYVKGSNGIRRSIPRNALAPEGRPAASQVDRNGTLAADRSQRALVRRLQGGAHAR
jgi:hypothetical protein